MNDISKPTDWARHATIIESLAQDNAAPLEEVEALYKVEVVRLERVASVKTFVSIIASRLVRNQLRDGKHIDLPPSEEDTPPRAKTASE